MEKITTKDGTHIAYQRTGKGDPLVLVHGTSAANGRWRPILPALAQHFTVYAIDRRGRGESGDSPNYAFAREFEDVAALVDSIGTPVNLMGHSYGAICALEAALLTSNLSKLILYEPPIPLPGVQIYPEGIIEQLQALLDQGDHTAVVTTFIEKVVKMPAHDLALFTSAPSFPARVAAAHTIPRELHAHQAYQFSPERFKQLKVPTLLLLGGDSPPFFKAAIEAAHQALGNSQIVVLPGQQHIAIDTAPELFTQAVLAFLAD